jgi:hypothetical protein
LEIEACEIAPLMRWDEMVKSDGRKDTEQPVRAVDAEILAASLGVRSWK